MTPALMEKIHVLWDELSAFPPSRIDNALVHLMGWFQQHLDVDNVLWLGSLLMLEKDVATQDPLLGWRLRARRVLLPDTEEYLKLVSSYFGSAHYGKLTAAYYGGKHGPGTDVHVGVTSRALVEEAGKFRSHRMRDGWIDFAKFRRSDHYDLYYNKLGISDRIWVAFPLDDHTESIFLLDRHHRKGSSRKNFTDSDTALAATVLRGLREFHRRLLLGHGVLRGVKSLSPLKVKILAQLLSGRPEKEIASALSQKPLTLRKTISAIYTEFGVKTRPELLALWLGEN